MRDEMIEKLTEITIGKKKLPIRCDINILAMLQEEYGTLNNFRQLLIGTRPLLNRDGSIRYDSDGNMLFRRTEPSIKVIKECIPYLVKEGIEKAEEQGITKYSDIEWQEAFKDFDFDYVETAVLINEEFERCFYRKKKTTSSQLQEQEKSELISTES